MPVTKGTTSTTWNFSWRERPRAWVDEPVTATDEDGYVYSITLLADYTGTIINPVAREDLVATVTTTNELLLEIRELLKSIAEV